MNVLNTTNKLYNDLVFYGVITRNELDQEVKEKGLTKETLYEILETKTGYKTFQELKDFHNGIK